MKKKKILMGSIVVTVLILVIILVIFIFLNKQSNNFKINLTNLTYETKNEKEEIKKYTEKEFEKFLKDYKNNNLPKVYITEFLFDGVSTYKPYDLDDFVENGNDYEVKTLKINAVNINTTGNIELFGKLTGGMIAVNTNNVKKDINVILNNVKIDTDSKNIPAIYVYNKDINYTDTKVSINLEDNTKNYISGGKFKKVSLVGTDELENYTDKYNETNKTNYEKYTNYYGVYSSSDIENILFAKVEANSEKLRDGDPYYYYKGAGAISSDIDLYFKGSGYLEVTSKKKEGIETKGNLTLGDGTGDYVVYAMDDCLNTTTTATSTNKNVRNTLTIDVKSLSAIVLDEAEEGDAIDSNGKMVINGGTIIALSHPGADSGLDSETGTYINGGTIIGIGDMYNEIKSDSKQNFMFLSFSSSIQVGDLITLLDGKDNVIFAFESDRVYRNLVFSSNVLKDGTYYLYKNGEINGIKNNGFYNKINSYEKGTQLAYSSKGNISGMGGRMQHDKYNDNNDDDNPPELPDDKDKTIHPDDDDTNKLNRNKSMKPKDDDNNERNIQKPFMNENSDATASNKEFSIDGISNLFSGVSIYLE